MHKESNLCFKYFSVYSLFNEPTADAIKLDYPLKRLESSIDTIVGSCNGLICISTEQNTVHLWNPSTKETRILPPVGCERFGRHYNVVYGLGYDHSIDDYKVVSVCYSCGDVSLIETEVKVFTLKTKSWRTIGEFPYGSPQGESGIFVSGALNGEVEYEDGAGGGHPNSSWRIVALDLASETYREIPHPIHEVNFDVQSLGVLGGNLSIICQNRCSHADVWVMKEYGVRESWNKMFRIPYLTDVDVFDYYYTPLCYSKNGELLLEFLSEFVLYNSNDDTFQPHKIMSLDACLYVESLVSPNPGD